MIQLDPKGDLKGDQKGDQKGNPKGDQKGDQKEDPNEDPKGDPKKFMVQKRKTIVGWGNTTYVVHMYILTKTCYYRGSPVITVSISAIPGIVQVENSTK